MRRKDCEMKDREQILDVIKRCDVVRIGMVDEDGYAYMVPVNFGMEIQDDKCSLYFHSALAGKKIDILKKNPAVSFEMDTAHELQESEVVAHHTYHYECVMGRGRVTFVEDAQEKARALNILMKQYTGRDDWELPAPLFERTHALRLDISEWSAKKH